MAPLPGAILAEPRLFWGQHSAVPSVMYQGILELEGKGKISRTTSFLFEFQYFVSYGFYVNFDFLKHGINVFFIGITCFLEHPDILYPR